MKKQSEMNERPNAAILTHNAHAGNQRVSVYCV